MGRDMGRGLPFTRTVRGICGTCNGGWMCHLEAAVKSSLAPLIRGEAGSLSAEIQPVVAKWVHKTALVGMLMNAAEDRQGRPSIPEGEYEGLYQARDVQRPLSATHFWVGRYDGLLRPASIWVTPMVVHIDGLAEAELPHAYLMTVLVGKLILQGLRFHVNHCFIEVVPGSDFQPIWPTAGDISWPRGGGADDEAFVSQVVKGRHCRTPLPAVSVRYWAAATDLPSSEIEGNVVRLPAICRRCVLAFPRVLMDLGRQGTFSWFVATCGCNISYVLRTELEKTSCKASGSYAEMVAAYDAQPGLPRQIEFEGRTFDFKTVPSQ